MFSFSYLGQNPRFLTRSFKSTESSIKRFIFSNFYFAHYSIPPSTANQKVGFGLYLNHHKTTILFYFNHRHLSIQWFGFSTIRFSFFFLLKDGSANVLRFAQHHRRNLLLLGSLFFLILALTLAC